MGCRLAFCPVDCSGALLTVQRSWSADHRAMVAGGSADSKQNKTKKIQSQSFFFFFCVFFNLICKTPPCPWYQMRRSNKSLTRQSHGSNAVHSDMDGDVMEMSLKRACGWDGGSVWCNYGGDSELCGRRHCWWQMGLFQKKKLLIHWYFRAGTTGRCLYAFGSNVENHLTLGKVDRDLFFFPPSLGNSPPSLLSSPSSREKASVGVDTFQRSRVSVFSVSFTLRRGRAAAICHLSRTCEASRTLKRAGRIVRDPSRPWHTQSVWGASPWQEGCRWAECKRGATAASCLPPGGGSRSPLPTLCTLTGTNISSFCLF